MTASPILTATELAAWTHDPPQIVDCRWRLGKPGASRLLWQKARIRRAVFLDLDEDLASIGDGSRGRHPLPDPQVLCDRLAAAGIGGDLPLVVYDDMGGAIAARFWWMMSWLGGPQTQVLVGGFPAWQAAGLPCDSGKALPVTPARHPILPMPQEERVVELDELTRPDHGHLLLDAREQSRFAGEQEPIDAAAGHIPGARCAEFTGNLGDDGEFLSTDQLRLRFEELGATDGASVVCYCGSGVTACHNLLAMELAGLPGGRLYVGSWSEWSSNDALPVETGDTDQVDVE